MGYHHSALSDQWTNNEPRNVWARHGFGGLMAKMKEAQGPKRFLEWVSEQRSLPSTVLLFGGVFFPNPDPLQP